MPVRKPVGSAREGGQAGRGKAWQEEEEEWAVERAADKDGLRRHVGDEAADDGARDSFADVNLLDVEAEHQEG